MQTIIACKRCAAILGEKFYKLYELAPVNEPCSVCRKTENVKRYEFERRGRKKPDGMPKRDTRAGMRNDKNYR